MKFNKEITEAPIWKDTVFGFEELESQQLAYWNKTFSADYK
jgi:hypothetical protein